MDRESILKSVPENVDNLQVSKIIDKIEQTEKTGIASFTFYMDPAVSSYIIKKLKISRLTSIDEIDYDKPYLYGGYNDAERVMMVIPGYNDNNAENSENADKYFTLVRVKLVVPKKAIQKLSHRDYLGAVMGLGIKREMVGDILVNNTGADLITQPAMGMYIKDNLRSVGRYTAEACILPIRELQLAVHEGEEKRDSVPSMRLDCIVGSAFNLSRTKAQEYVASGVVNVNWVQITKLDYIIKQNDVISLRGMGRFKIISVDENKLKSNRILITMVK